VSCGRVQTYDGASSETLAQLARLYEETTHPLAQLARLYEETTHPLVLRPRATVEDFFAGFALVEPGLVFAPAWRPDRSPSPFTNEPERAAVLAGVGRKP